MFFVCDYWYIYLTVKLILHKAEWFRNLEIEYYVCFKVSLKDQPWMIGVCPLAMCLMNVPWLKLYILALLLSQNSISYCIMLANLKSWWLRQLRIFVLLKERSMTFQFRPPDNKNLISRQKELCINVLPTGFWIVTDEFAKPGRGYKTPSPTYPPTHIPCRFATDIFSFLTSKARNFMPDIQGVNLKTIQATAITVILQKI